MQKIYVDTNVFISYWDSEYGRKVTDAFECFSEQLFNRAIDCEFHIYISDKTFQKLRGAFGMPSQKARFLLSGFTKVNKMTFLESSEEIWDRANEINKNYKTHRADALHAAFAEKEDAILVTWNIKDFEGMNFLEIRTPKEL